MVADGPTPTERFLQGIIPENPVYRQLLGMCPTLAVTGTMPAAMTMVGATAFVLFCANVLTSLLRNMLKPHLRILVFTLTIATFVTIADRFLAAYMWDMSKTLGPYIPLIIVNCMIICRCEVCASKQNVVTAMSDALGQSVGFGLALASIASVREILGTQTWFGLDVLGWMSPLQQWLVYVAGGASELPGWLAWSAGLLSALGSGLGWLENSLGALKLGVMGIPAGAFISLGLLLGLANWIGAIRAKKRATPLQG